MSGWQPMMRDRRVELACNLWEETIKHPARPSAATDSSAASRRVITGVSRPQFVIGKSSAQARQKGAAPSAFAFTSPRPLRGRCEGEGGRGLPDLPGRRPYEEKRNPCW